MSGKNLINIGESIRRIAGSITSIALRAGRVESVNVAEGTCTVLLTGDEAATEGVLLNAVSNNANGMLLIPKLQSVVWVSEIDGAGLRGVVRYSDITQMVVNVNGSTAEIEVTSGKVVFNGGSFGGMVKVNELVSKINRLENIVNNLISLYNSHTHPYVNVTTPAVTSITTSVQGTTATPITTAGDLKNDNVKH